MLLPILMQSVNKISKSVKRKNRLDYENRTKALQNFSIAKVKCRQERMHILMSSINHMFHRFPAVPGVLGVYTDPLQLP